MDVWFFRVPEPMPSGTQCVLNILEIMTVGASAYTGIEGVVLAVKECLVECEMDIVRNPCREVAQAERHRVG